MKGLEQRRMQYFQALTLADGLSKRVFSAVFEQVGTGVKF